MHRKVPKWLIIVLEEMFKRVHKRFSCKALERDDWFTKASWTIEEEKDFAKWLRDWLDHNCHEYQETLNWRKSMPARLKKARIAGFLLDYGWRYK